MGDLFKEPLPGGAAGQTQDQVNQNGQAARMTPTPAPAHLAHCCDCLQRELQAALERQQRDIAHAQDDTRQGNFQVAMQVAERILDHKQGPTEEAGAFLKKCFEHFEKQVGNVHLASMPRLS
jgi:NAD-dependent oxidoreductase involved in siderophore biosynthesis